MGANRLTRSEAKERQAEGVEAARQSIPVIEQDRVPEHASQVIDWIGQDPERAQRALDAENERTKPRATVVEHAEKVIEDEA